MNEHRKPRGWRPWQFSLRALMLLTLVVASYLGGWMSHAWQQQREMERAKQEAEAQMNPNQKMMEQMMMQAMQATPAPVPTSNSEQE